MTIFEKGTFNANQRKISNTERQRFAKGTESDTTPTPKNNKMLQYINDVQIVYGDKKSTKAELEAATKRVEADTPKKISKQDEYNIYFNKKSPKYYAKKIPVKPRPDLPNGHSSWTSDDFLHSIDPSLWMEDNDKKAGLLEYELADEYWQEQYQIYLNQGGTLNYKDFLQTQMNQKVNREIDKRIKNKKRAEGLAALVGVKA